MVVALQVTLKKWMDGPATKKLVFLVVLLRTRLPFVETAIRILDAFLQAVFHRIDLLQFFNNTKAGNRIFFGALCQRKKVSNMYQNYQTVLPSGADVVVVGGSEQVPDS